HAATAEIAHEVRRGHGLAPRLTDQMQHTGERDVVDGMTCRAGERAVLTPARYPPVNEAGIASQTRFRAEAQSFHPARTEAFDQNIGAFNQPERDRGAGRLLQIERDRSAAALQRIPAGLVLRRGADALDTYDVRTHVSQHHA